jgi:osmotically-inducible protein OsmY
MAAACALFSKLNLSIWAACLAPFLILGCASEQGRKILPYSDEIADVSLPAPYPAPRNGPDVENGTVTAASRPAHEKLTRSAQHKMISDDRLRTEMLAAIVDDPAVDPFQFRFRVEDGKVQVLGRGSERQQKRVAETISRVRGVREVESTVKISSDEAPTWAVPKTDEEIEREIVDANQRDSRVDFSRIEIRVRDGVVALLGSVPNLRTSRAIEKNAKMTQGVRQVINQLEVKPKYIRDDDRLTRDVKAALALDPILQSDKITVSARQGVVSLAGEVSSDWKKERAVELGSEVFGVVAIQSRLQSAAMPAPSDDASQVAR